MQAARELAFQLLRGPQLFVIATQFIRIGLLAGYLFASTRLLGPVGYGVLATAVALAAVGATVVGMGTGIGLVRQSARNPGAFSDAWGTCLGRHVLSSLVLFFAFVAFSVQWIGTNATHGVLIAIGLTELVLAPLGTAAGYAFIAHARYRTGAALQILPAAARLIAVIWLSQREASADLLTFSTTVMLAVMSAISIALWVALRLLPSPAWVGARALLKLDYSMTYAGSNLVNGLTSEADKLVVYQMTSADQTGIYSAWTRIISALCVPFGAAIQARSHHLFGMGREIGKAHFLFLARYGSAFAVYGLGCVLLSSVLSPLLLSALGAGFEGSGPLFLVLAMAIPINGYRQLVGSVLTTSDRAGRRTVSDVMTTSVFVGFSLALIPGEGVMGAAKAKVCSELAGLVISAAMLLRAWRSQA